MLCPRCKEALHVRTIEEVKIDQCLQCQGIWFDQDELRKAKDTVEPDLNWMDFELWRTEDEFEIRSSSISCPKCHVPLVTMEYRDTEVEIDYCAQCESVWLDGGEFQRILTALGEEIAEKNVPDYIAASLDEAQELVGGADGTISEWQDFLTVLRLLQYRVLVENPKLRDIAAAFQRGATSF